MKNFKAFINEAQDNKALLRGDYKQILKSAHGLSAKEGFDQPDKMKNALDQLFQMHKNNFEKTEFSNLLKSTFTKEIAHLKKLGKIK